MGEESIFLFRWAKPTILSVLVVFHNAIRQMLSYLTQNTNLSGFCGISF
jgi:hypothetical protein